MHLSIKKLFALHLSDSGEIIPTAKLMIDLTILHFINIQVLYRQLSNRDICLELLVFFEILSGLTSITFVHITFTICVTPLTFRSITTNLQSIDLPYRG